MKKLFTFLSVMLMALSFASCRGPQGPKGDPGRDGLVFYKVIDLDVTSNQWGYSDQDNNNYFFAKFNVPELTWDIYNNGIIKVYREYNTGSNNASQVELPFVRHNEYLSNSNGQQFWGFYTETVDYEFTAGQVIIYYTASDFDYELDTSFVPEGMHFRLIMMW
ncbi:MAG: hypothetical protein MJZ89_05670 [Paludibacteraceae bacterium]|nr:hypothetical protein [Paludibacteraceae bacterium]